MKNNFLRIIDEDETEVTVEVISILENESNKYIIYTKGERQKSGNLIIYISKLKLKEEKYYIENIHSEEEWGKVKILLSKIINK